VPFENLAVSEP